MLPASDLTVTKYSYMSQCFASFSRSMKFFFFFKAEDGIRDYKVTGFQRCALPIPVVLRTASSALRRSLFTFDCLLRGEEDLMGRPYTERRKALEAVLKPTEGIRHSTVRVTDDVKQAESFFDEALQAGCEGLMAKALDSTYDAGARGYQWIKFKKEYSAALSDTIDLVIVGAFAGRGKRAGSYGALLVAAYDEQE